jgi:hypothetical protein
MSNFIYDKARDKFLQGGIAWKSGGDTFRAYLIDNDSYTPDQAADEFLSAIPDAEQIAYAALTPSNPGAGVADAADITFTAVTGDVCEVIVIVKWVTSKSDSPLIAYIDTATGLPVTPNGGDINVVWDAGSNRIFKL